MSRFRPTANSQQATLIMSMPYRRLDPSKQEIRLLELHPARGINDDVEARLVTVRLTDKPDFIALSSLYGDANETDRVYVGGRPVELPSHLVQGLKHVRAVFYPTISLRYQRKPARKPHGAPRWLRQLLGMSSSKDSKTYYDPDKPRMLRVWLDIICVNQGDEGEKSRQLVEMRAIYRSAELVVGWLGVKAETTDAAMSCLSDIEDAMPARWGDPGDREKNPDDYAPTHRWASTITYLWAVGPKGESPFTLPHWAGCHDFMSRQYFQRRWILEEISMARFPCFLIGDIIVPWKQILRLNRMMEEFKNNDSNVWPATAHKLLDEFAKKEALEDAKILRDHDSRTTSSTRSDSNSNV
ncbi:Heterokaryon incompatibility protein (HET) [Geosmithia morbida]|uniref:Heterokaryon incompatibility protein (HET) n=1 Tax=Geosmithia morbida TaxID=1094350 RepID=A0A9P4YS09_9HYPO|nr:Heterokaryon incompatibility protein (HET) [Geosmithia morbida]KAF4121467.1 Heterokaryon incompatibility protein (HET) [Geosmithia morbida]